MSRYFISGSVILSPPQMAPFPALLNRHLIETHSYRQPEARGILK